MEVVKTPPPGWDYREWARRVLKANARPYLDRDGYMRVFDDDTGLRYLVHRLVWAATYGAIPNGIDVHHKDFDRLNNSLDNLASLSHSAHTQLHQGRMWGVIRDAQGRITHKHCVKCRQILPVTRFYPHKSPELRGRLNPYCKACRSAYYRIKRIEWRREAYNGAGQLTLEFELSRI